MLKLGFVGSILNRHHKTKRSGVSILNHGECYMGLCTCSSCGIVGGLLRTVMIRARIESRLHSFTHLLALKRAVFLLCLYLLGNMTISNHRNRRGFFLVVSRHRQHP